MKRDKQWFMDNEFFFMQLNNAFRDGSINCYEYNVLRTMFMNGEIGFKKKCKDIKHKD